MGSQWRQKHRKVAVVAVAWLFTPDVHFSVNQQFRSSVPLLLLCCFLSFVHQSILKLTHLSPPATIVAEVYDCHFLLKIKNLNVTHIVFFNYMIVDNLDKGFKKKDYVSKCFLSHDVIDFLPLPPENMATANPLRKRSFSLNYDVFNTGMYVCI